MPARVFIENAVVQEMLCQEHGSFLFCIGFFMPAGKPRLVGGLDVITSFQKSA